MFSTMHNAASLSHTILTHCIIREWVIDTPIFGRTMKFLRRFN
jgi:hypothetical protein